MMESIARVSKLAKRFLVERPKELERTSGFGKPKYSTVRRTNLCANVCAGLDEQRSRQLFPAQSCRRLIGRSCAQSGQRRALWRGWKRAFAAIVGRSGGAVVGRASGGNAAV